LQASRWGRPLRRERPAGLRAGVRAPCPRSPVQRRRPNGSAGGAVAMTSKLRVNPIACKGHGLCAELFPERISLDDWGYPIVDPTPIPPHLEALARKAAEACPTLALRLATAT